MLIVKVGGGKNINWPGLIDDIKSQKEDLVLVHGASTKRDEIAEKLNTPTKYLTSPSGLKGVYTDKEALDVLTMVYAGLVNKRIISLLQKEGLNAIGLSGADGRIWEGKRKKNLLSLEDGKTKLIKDTYTGKVTKTNADLIKLLISQGYLPVITQPAISKEGELINTDNDRNLAVLARDLGVEKLVVLFEAPGLLEDEDDEGSLVGRIRKEELDEIVRKVEGRMKKKALGAKEAMKNGVKKIYWGDSRVDSPIKSALKGEGTLIS